MKRFFLFLLMLLLAAAPGCAAFDASAYEVESAYGTQVLALSGGDALVLHRAGMNVGYFPTSVAYWSGESCLLRETLVDGMRYTLAAFSNERCGVAAEKDGVITWQEVTSSALGEPQLLGEGMDELETHACGLTALSRAPGGDTLMLFDEHLHLFAQLALPYEKASVLGFCADAHGYLLLVSSKMGYEATAMRLNADGGVCWTQTVNQQKTRYNKIYADGQGGAFLEGSLESDYKQSSLAHISAAGQIDAEKTLCVKNAIISTAHAAVNEDGSVTLFGSAVANSRSLYDAFALTIDPSLNVLSLDVRDFSVREDYGFEYRVASDGTVYVFTSGEGFGSSERKNALLVPFAVLPTAPDPGIALR